MARYFFEIDDGRNRTRDEEGQELASVDEARKLAVRELAEIIRDDMPDGQRESYVVIVRDDAGRSVYIATAMMLAEGL